MTHLYCNKCGSRDIQKSSGKNYYTITESDIHETHNTTAIRFEGRGYSYPGGYVMKQDIGKRLVVINGLMYMENQEQFEARLEKEA